MIWLTLQMWVLLLTAFLIGLAIGWWIWGVHPESAAPKNEATPEALPQGSLNSE